MKRRITKLSQTKNPDKKITQTLTFTKFQVHSFVKKNVKPFKT